MGNKTIQAKKGKSQGISRYLPILTWLPKYERVWLRDDIIAGLTVLALLVSEGMAYAEIAGICSSYHRTRLPGRLGLNPGKVF